MPCLLVILIAAFPRLAIILLYLLTSFFSHAYNSLLLPVLGFLFLPLTLIAYTYVTNQHMPMDAGTFVILFLAVIFDLGLVGRVLRR